MDIPGTTIVSDGWGAYAHINDINDGVYQHLIINHSLNFVDPIILISILKI